MDRRQMGMFLIVLLSGLCIRGGVLFSDAEQLVKVIPDDTFYYLETAKHIVAGEGSTFDGVNETNGYHPLWMALLLPIVAAVSDPWLLVRSTLALSIVFNLGTAIVLYATLRKHLNVWYVPVIGTAVYYLNARSIVTSLGGMEVMVSSFLFCVSLYLSMLVNSRTSDPVRVNLFLGLSLGLLFLARTDNVFYIMVFYGAAVWRTLPALRMRMALLMAGIMSLVASPWIVWNLVNFGSLMQSSGFAIPFVLRESFIADGHTSLELVWHSAKMFLSFVGWRMYKFYIGFPPLAYLPILAGTIYLVTRKWKQLELAEYANANRVAKLVSLLAVAGLALIFVHTFLRWYPRNYYFDSIIILSAVGFSVGLSLLHPAALLVRIRANSTMFSHLVAVAALVVIMIPGAYSGYRLLNRGESPHQIEFLNAAKWLNNNTSSDAVIAGFNVGIVSYFSERIVINLDGAINTAAYDAIKRRRLMEYIEEMEVQYFVDYDPSMLEMYRLFLGMRSPSISWDIVKRIDYPDVAFQNNSIAVYRIQRSLGQRVNELEIFKASDRRGSVIP